MPSFDYDVFLSYDRHDADRVHRLAGRLRDEGLRVWLDDWVLRPEDDATRAIERGLQATRTLVLCLSSSAVASDWLRLERTSVLFRDASQADRRFVPLLLDECDVPEAVRHFRAVDYRGDEAEAFAELLAACRSQPASEEEAVAANKSSKPLVVLERKLEGHNGWVWSVAASSEADGRFRGPKTRPPRCGTWEPASAGPRSAAMKER